MSFMNIITSFISQSTNSASTPPSVQDHASATQALMQHFSEQPGGLGALANQFRQNGMASHVDSWLSPQANQPLEPQQVEQGLGGDALQSIAQRAGVSPTVIKLALATALPPRPGIRGHRSRRHGTKPLLPRALIRLHV
jgi:uncharacterized protein YidB (DUF937 family)